jgi:hypothetical protein
MTGSSGTRARAGRFVLAASASSFGLLGWSAAHLVTSQVLAHRHDAEHGIAAGVPHVHAVDAALVLIALALTASSLLAVLSTALNASSQATVSDLTVTARRAGRWCTTAFLGAELAAYAISDVHVVTPPLMLALAAAVHVLAGVAATAVWRRVAVGLFEAVAARSDYGPRRARAVRAVFRASEVHGSAWLTLRLSGRAPPAAVVSSI